MSASKSAHNIEEAFTSDACAFQETGFPNSYLISYLSEQMARINLALYSDKSISKRAYITFDRSGIKYRQEIMRKIQAEKGLESDYHTSFKRLGDSTAIRLLEKANSLRSRIPCRQEVNKKHFEKLCVGIADLYNLSNEFLKEFDEVSTDPTYRALRKKVGDLRSEFGALIKTIDSVDKIDVFQIDTRKGTILPVLDKDKLECQQIEVDHAVSSFEGIINPKNIARKSITDLHFDMIKDLRRNVLNKWDDEMCVPDTESDDGPTIVSYFVNLIKPYALFGAYKNYINSYLIEPKDDFGLDEDGHSLHRTKELSSLKFVYPKFGNRFDVRNLFPLAFSPKYNFTDQSYVPFSDYVPIDFETKPDEKKIAFMGLNSGGKSITLENLALSEFIGSMGLPLPADRILLPRCKRLVYYNNSRRGARGKLETEIRDVARIIKEAEKEDLMVIDNFFEGGTPQITTYIAHKYMDALADTDARVILESHAPLDLDHLERRGWTTFVPEYEIKHKKIKPTFKLKRGRPDPKVMMRYAVQMADKFLDSEEDDESDEK